jgi:hypothetical protein
LRLEVEPNVGANDYIIDMRVFLECRGAVGVSLGTGFTVGSGKPIVLRLGRAKGKNLGVVIEATIEPNEEWLGPRRGL